MLFESLKSKNTFKTISSRGQNQKETYCGLYCEVPELARAVRMSMGAKEDPPDTIDEIQEVETQVSNLSVVSSGP